MVVLTDARWNAPQSSETENIDLVQRDLYFLFWARRLFNQAHTSVSFRPLSVSVEESDAAVDRDDGETTRSPAREESMLLRGNRSVRQFNESAEMAGTLMIMV